MEKTASKVNEKSANKSVRFSEETDRKFTSLAEKLGRSKQEIFGQMVDYFYKSKKDPADLNDELLKKEISKGIGRIISFIQTQEKNSLTPILTDVREGKEENRQARQAQKDNWDRFFKQFHRLYYYNDEKETSQGAIMNLIEGFVNQRTQLNELTEEAKKNTQAIGSFKEEIFTAINKQKNYERNLQSVKEAFRLLLEQYMTQRESLNSYVGNNTNKVNQLQKEIMERFEKL